MTLSSKHIQYLVPVSVIICLVMALNLLDPSENVASILLVFLLIYLLIASFLFAVMRLYRHFINRLRPKSGGQSDSTDGRHVRRSYYIASIIAFAPILLLAMQSLQQLKLLDIALVSVLVGLGCLYVIKRT